MTSSCDPQGRERAEDGLSDPGRHVRGIHARAVQEAREFGHDYCTDVHLLLALLRPEVDTVARRVLVGLGATYAAVRGRFTARQNQGLTQEVVTTTPRLYGLLGAAAGIMVASDAPAFSDEHSLLALLYYTDHLGWTPITAVGLEPLAVVEGLREEGVWLPARMPISPSPIPAEAHSVVYFPSGHSSSVFPTLYERFGGYPGWSANVSNWKPGYHAVQGVEGLPVEEAVREAVTDQAAVTVVPLREAQENEQWSDGIF